MTIPSLDFHFSEEIEMLRDSLRAFANAEIAPRAAQIDRDNLFPADLWKKFGDLGLLGMTASEDDGGADMGYLAHIVAMEEISRASASVALSYGAHSNLCVNQIRRNGSPRRRRDICRSSLPGDHVGALAMSEPDAGSDVVSMRLRAEKKGDRYVLNGSKMWITNGGDADVLVVYAKTDPAAGAKGVTAFIVEKAFCRLFSCGPHLDKLGMRGSNTFPLFFDHCEVPEENVLGGVGQGVKVLMSGLDYERAVLCGGPLGIMAACMDLDPALPSRAQAVRPTDRRFPADAGQARGHVCRPGRRRAPMSMPSARPATAANIRAACARTRPRAILYSAEKATWMAGETIQALGGVGYTNDVRRRAACGATPSSMKSARAHRKSAAC